MEIRRRRIVCIVTMTRVSGNYVQVDARCIMLITAQWYQGGLIRNVGLIFSDTE